jgi:tetratricopeptide (TPR) repeat protein
LRLGERESGTARLEEAVAIYHDALKEYTRERVPLDWVMTQNNLGAALYLLGERESGKAKLEEAVVAYREALNERTREQVPLDWASTQHNLGMRYKPSGNARAVLHFFQTFSTPFTARRLARYVVMSRLAVWGMSLTQEETSWRPRLHG